MCANTRNDNDLKTNFGERFSYARVRAVRGDSLQRPKVMKAVVKWKGEVGKMFARRSRTWDAVGIFAFQRLGRICLEISLTWSNFEFLPNSFVWPYPDRNDDYVDLLM